MGSSGILSRLIYRVKLGINPNYEGVSIRRYLRRQWDNEIQYQKTRLDRLTNRNRRKSKSR